MSKKSEMKLNLEIIALNRANDLLTYTNKSLIRQKTLYESELDILCCRIDKALNVCSDCKNNKYISKIEKILKGCDN